VKTLALVAAPASVVTWIFPVVAPVGTVAVILTAVFTVKVAEVPLNWTAVVAVKLAPLIVTLVPAAPLAGVKLVIRGATVKLFALVAVPPTVVTVIGPVVAFAGTLAVIWVLESTWNTVAELPLNFTDEAPVKVVPAIVTGVPMTPLVGVTFVMAGLTVTFPVLMPVPAAVVTLILPVVAAAGTLAVIWMAELTM
jgi:hypothetical protein